MDHDITLHAEHLPGKLNVIADFESRHVSDGSDWQLDVEIFSHLQQIHGPFSVDLFASFRNAQLKVFYSWKADPQPQTILLPSICTHREMSAEDQERQRSVCNHDRTNLASSNLVPSPSQLIDPPSTNHTESSKSSNNSSGGESSTSTAGSSAPGCMANIRKSLSEKGVSQQSTSYS